MRVGTQFQIMPIARATQPQALSFACGSDCPSLASLASALVRRRSLPPPAAAARPCGWQRRAAPPPSPVSCRRPGRSTGVSLCVRVCAQSMASWPVGAGSARAPGLPVSPFDQFVRSKVSNLSKVNFPVPAGGRARRRRATFGPLPPQQQ